MRYLDRHHYVGIEPNRWLLDAAMTDWRVRVVVATSRPPFLGRTDFDASSTGRVFDYVLAHSALSHFAHRQLEEFIRNVARVLQSQGRILASIRLAEGNAYGSPGAPDGDDSMDAEWQYPDVSWFKFDTVERVAAQHGLTVVVKPEYTQRFISRRPREIHDWLVFSH